MTDRLYVAAKAPRPGFVKTRLGRGVGDANAVHLYRAFLSDLANRLRGLPVSVGWFVTPDDGWQEVSAVVGDGWAAPVSQGPGDWGARQDRLFRTAPARAEERVVLIASDSPQVGLDLIVEAFAALESNDLVLGPVLDGGYWLIGMRRYLDILANTPMSTPDVLAALLGRADREGCAVHLLAPVFDVDEAGDLERLADATDLRDDMPATRSALRLLGSEVTA